MKIEGIRMNDRRIVGRLGRNSFVSGEMAFGVFATRFLRGLCASDLSSKRLTLLSGILLLIKNPGKAL